MRYLLLLFLFSCVEDDPAPVGCVTWTSKLDPTVQIMECDYVENPQLIVDGIWVTPGWTYTWVKCDECK